MEIICVFTCHVRATLQQKYECGDGGVHSVRSAATAAHNNNNVFVFVFTALIASRCLSAKRHRPARNSPNGCHRAVNAEAAQYHLFANDFFVRRFLVEILLSGI